MRREAATAAITPSSMTPWLVSSPIGSLTAISVAPARLMMPRALQWSSWLRAQRETLQTIT
ncbi:MAG TPA: hypothetical protein VL988_06285 [Solirubrobacteraceae bacterium]|nr:hypothetical protein [Solirubrobacteraceae bacterium]